MCDAIKDRDGNMVCDVKYIGYVIKEGVVYYRYECVKCRKITEVRV
jgi:hypothetical protein